MLMSLCLFISFDAVIQQMRGGASLRHGLCKYVVYVMQRLWKMTQPTDDWLPADDDAKQIVQQQQQHHQQQQRTMTMTPRSPVACNDTSVELTGYRPCSLDFTDHVIDHVTVDINGGHINTALDHRD